MHVTSIIDDLYRLPMWFYPAWTRYGLHLDIQTLALRLLPPCLDIVQFFNLHNAQTRRENIFPSDEIAQLLLGWARLTSWAIDQGHDRGQDRLILPQRIHIKTRGGGEIVNVGVMVVSQKLCSMCTHLLVMRV